MKSNLFATPFASAIGVLALFFSAFTPPFGTLTFHVSGVDSANGVVRVVLYSSDKDFLSENGYAVADSAYANASGVVDVVLPHVPFGKYAAAIYQDENQNGVIDQNLMRIPTEPYTFSNGVRAKWGVPSFDETAFMVMQSNERFEATLRSWSKQ